MSQLTLAVLASGDQPSQPCTPGADGLGAYWSGPSPLPADRSVWTCFW